MNTCIVLFRKEVWEVICYFQNCQDGLIGKSFNQILIMLFFPCPNRFIGIFYKSHDTEPGETCAQRLLLLSLVFLRKQWGCCSQSLTGTESRELIPPVLTTLPLPPVHTRIDFKLLFFVYKSLNGIAPQYMLVCV